MGSFKRDLKKLRTELKMQKESTGKIVILIYRLGNYAEYKTKGIKKKLLLVIWYILDSLITKLLFNTIIPRHVRIGYGLSISHPFNIVMARQVVIGKHSHIRHEVTIGRKTPDNPNVARIGDNVDIGAGTKIIGPVTIGDNTVIGIGSVVTKSFQADSVIAGNPAKSIVKDDNYEPVDYNTLLQLKSVFKENA